MLYGAKTLSYFLAIGRKNCLILEKIILIIRLWKLCGNVLAKVEKAHLDSSCDIRPKKNVAHSPALPHKLFNIKRSITHIGHFSKKKKTMQSYWQELFIY